MNGRKCLIVGMSGEGSVNIWDEQRSWGPLTIVFVLVGGL